MLTNLYPCSVYLTLYDAHHQVLQPNWKVKRLCNPADAGPGRLAPGDSLRYALESPHGKYDEEELRKARSFDVLYQGHIWPQQEAKRAQRRLLYTLKIARTIE